MMREIKFRAWNPNAKEYQGYIPGNVHMPLHEAGALATLPIVFEFQQYTGLKDKNGVDIYGGDIVEEPGSRYEIVYHADGFYMRNMYEPDNILIQLRHGYLHCEVIGNIYENPEFLANQSNKKGE